MTNTPRSGCCARLYGTWFPTLPFFSEIFTKCGQVLGTVENGNRLLEKDELVAVYPEGYKGVGKLFSERYRLARFGRGGFIKMALKTGAPIIPVSVVGAEETYISLRQVADAGAPDGIPILPDLADLPMAGSVWLYPAAHQMVHRLRRADPDRRLWP